jgi:hypothetical protein
MKSKQFLKEGFVEDAQEAQMDHEVQMARVDCYYAAEHAMVLHKLLRNISEEQGLEGWVASKITLANDYLKSVREHLEYQMMSADADESDFLPIAEGLNPVKKNKINESDDNRDMNDFERGPWYIILKGSPVSENGSPKKFNWLNGAKTFFRTIMDEDPKMAEKIKQEYEAASDKKSIIYYSKKLPTTSSQEETPTMEASNKPGLWANIRAKRERIKSGSGERMRAPGSKGAPSDKDLKSIRAASESTENANSTWYDNLTGKYPKTKLALDLLPPTAMATSAVDAVNNLSKGNYGAAAVDAAGLLPGVKPLSKFLPRSLSIDNISRGRKVGKGTSTVKDVGDYIDSEFPHKVNESDFHSQFAAMIDDMKKSGKLKTGDSTKSQAKYAPEPSREELDARLRDLESEFDPAYQQSDDYSFWKKQNDIASEISSIRRQLRQQGVAEGQEDLEEATSMKQQWKNDVKQVHGNNVRFEVNKAVRSNEETQSEAYDENGNKVAYFYHKSGRQNILPKPKVNEDLSKTDIKKQISKFEELALAANRAGDDEKSKQYQRKIQSLKQKMSQDVTGGLSDVVKGVKRKISGKKDPKEVAHTYARIARRDIEDANKLNNQAAYDARDKSTKRWEKVNKVVNKEGVAEGEVIRPDFSRGKGVENPNINAPKGYDRFESDGKKIIGIKDGKKTIVSTTSDERLARELVMIYNGGKVSTELKPISMLQAFGSKQLATAENMGIKLAEKPDHWADFEEYGFAAENNFNQIKLKKLEKAVGKLKTYKGVDIYGKTTFGDKPRGPQSRTIFMPSENMFIIKFDDGTRYVVDKTGAATYIRNWQKIDDMLDIKEQGVAEGIKGWKHAHSDMMKHRAESGKDVHLVSLKKDGTESKMHDAKKSFKSEEEARAHHKRVKELNPNRTIAHNLYVGGKVEKLS